MHIEVTALVKMEHLLSNNTSFQEVLVIAIVYNNESILKMFSQSYECWKRALFEALLGM